MEQIIAYIGRDNTQTVLLEYKPKGSIAYETVPINTVTRAILRFGDYCLDTDDADPKFELTENETELAMQLGMVPNLVAGNYIGKLTIYDGTHPEGIPWQAYEIWVENWDVCPI